MAQDKENCTHVSIFKWTQKVYELCTEYFSLLKLEYKSVSHNALQ